ncbi:hypothetical protein Bbelb_224390 [Branchiostoma belcheri]|nr:hypothetical protein Bbelb_224390 [Branchiostoma belcheri]
MLSVCRYRLFPISSVSGFVPGFVSACVITVNSSFTNGLSADLPWTPSQTWCMGNLIAKQMCGVGDDLLPRDICHGEKVGARKPSLRGKCPSAANRPSRRHITRVAQRKNYAHAQQDCEGGYPWAGSITVHVDLMKVRFIKNTSAARRAIVGPELPIVPLCTTSATRGERMMRRDQRDTGRSAGRQNCKSDPYAPRGFLRSVTVWPYTQDLHWTAGRIIRFLTGKKAWWRLQKTDSYKLYTYCTSRISGTVSQQQQTGNHERRSSCARLLDTTSLFTPELGAHWSDTGASRDSDDARAHVRINPGGCHCQGKPRGCHCQGKPSGAGVAGPACLRQKSAGRSGGTQNSSGAINSATLGWSRERPARDRAGQTVLWGSRHRGSNILKLCQNLLETRQLPSLCPSWRVAFNEKRLLAERNRTTGKDGLTHPTFP